jgi:HPt (histidine-containing phosphotransfer) domain-containing protein
VTSAANGSDHRAAPVPLLWLAPTLERLAGDVDLFRELAGILLATAPKQLQSIDDAIAAGDMKQAHRHLHSLRGAVITFECPAVIESLLRVEQSARTGQAGAASDTFPEARLFVEQLLGELKRHARDRSGSG